MNDQNVREIYKYTLVGYGNFDVLELVLELSESIHRIS